MATSAGVSDASADVESGDTSTGSRQRQEGQKGRVRRGVSFQSPRRDAEQEDRDVTEPNLDTCVAMGRREDGKESAASLPAPPLGQPTPILTHALDDAEDEDWM